MAAAVKNLTGVFTAPPNSNSTTNSSTNSTRRHVRNAEHEYTEVNSIQWGFQCYVLILSHVFKMMDKDGQVQGKAAIVKRQATTCSSITSTVTSCTSAVANVRFSLPSTISFLPLSHLPVSPWSSSAPSPPPPQSPAPLQRRLPSKTSLIPLTLLRGSSPPSQSA